MLLITSYRKMEVQVSVLCTAYNHEKYIKECLEGFVSQQTSFPFEVLINDDASTDNTAKIIKEYEAKYPELIRGVYQKENCWTKGVNINGEILLPLARGKYTAFCEGDDYWSDSQKLQKQYIALENNPDCYMAVHRTQKMRENGELCNAFIPNSRTKEGLISSYEFITKKSEFHVSSFFIRTDALKEYSYNLPKFRRVVNFGDIPYQLYFGNLGPVYCVNSVMSSYRMCSVGGWSYRLSHASPTKMDEHYDMVSKMFAEYDIFTHGKYHKYCLYKQKAAKFRKQYAHGEYMNLFQRQYWEVLLRLSLKQKMGIVFRLVLSCLKSVKVKYRRNR